MTRSTVEPPATERELLALLERRHARQGNGGSGEYAFLTHVRNEAGFKANRTFDAVAVSLWPSRGHAIDVFEVKVSKSDWKRELAKPEKSEDAYQFGDRYTIVATAGIVNLDDLPQGWGLIEAYGGKVTDEGVVGRRLRTVRAPEWHGPKVKDAVHATITRGQLVGYLRRAGAVPAAETPAEAVVNAALAKAVEATADQWRQVLDLERARNATLADDVRRFQSISGVQISTGYGATREHVEATAARVKAALGPEADGQRVRARLQHLHTQLITAANQVEEAMRG